MIGIIQAYVDGGAVDASVLAAAASIALRFQSHIDVIHVCAARRPAAPTDLQASAAGKDLVEEKAAHVRQLFDSWREQAMLEIAETAQRKERPSVCFRKTIGQKERVIVDRGRLADLIVVARPDTKPMPPAVHPVTSALFGCGRPVIVMPPDGVLDPTGVALVAWNGSIPAVRAVAEALPFLRGARAVMVLSIAGTSGDGLPRANELIAYLGWQGIPATATTGVASAGAVGPAVLQQAEELHASFLVMGAYTHGWLYQRMLGGATEHVLWNTTIPVLMAR